MCCKKVSSVDFVPLQSLEALKLIFNCVFFNAHIVFHYSGKKNNVYDFYKSI